MARFYFDLHACGEVVPDEDGLDCSNLDAARECAVKAARDVMRGEISEGKLCLSCHIEVRDDQGAVVMSVPFREAVEISG